MGMTVICFHNNNEENGYLFLNGAVYDVPQGTFLWR